VANGRSLTTAQRRDSSSSMRGRVRAFGGACGALFAFASVTVGAAAGGAPSISAAPLISVGQQQINAVAGIDYWHVKLLQGDRLTLEYGPQKENHWVEVCVYRPGVTDTTVATDRCYAGSQSLRDDSLAVTARPSGVWTIAVRPYPGCSSSGGVTDPRCTNAGVEYKLTAIVQHETHMRLSAPNLVRAGERVRLSGALQGAHGRVLLETSLSNGDWTTLNIERVDSAGRFAATMRARQAGSLRVRATFPETPQYAGSSATVTIRVA
jgi:hypothetical protein